MSTGTASSTAAASNRDARPTVRSRATARGIGVLAALALGVASCATPHEVEHTRRVAKDYESQVFDLEKRIQQLQRENAQLSERYNRERRSGLVNASADSTLSNRLEDLGERIATMDRPMKSIERFDVEGGYLLMIQDRILFDSGSAELGAEGRQALVQLSNEIAAAPHGTIFVRGHTDTDKVSKPETVAKFPHGNLQLSAARAVSVAAELVEQTSIQGDEVVVMGFGPHKPIGPNNSADAKRLNRRVEIFVSDRASQ